MGAGKEKEDSEINEKYDSKNVLPKLKENFEHDITEKEPKGIKVQKAISKVKGTLKELEESIKRTQTMERTYFQNELKLVTDNQQLLLQLDKEKYKYAQLKKLKSLKDRCSILSEILRKRDNQLGKAKQEMEAMQILNNSLQKAINIKERKYRRLLGKYVELYTSIKTTDNNYSEPLKEEINQLQTQLKNQERQYDYLKYINNCLKSVLTKSKSLFDFSSQVSENDFQNEDERTG